MATATDLTSVIRRLGLPDEERVGDPELLDHFARGRDQDAFATLVRRYGALVFGVARRQLADRHRAEDVFQATFLALARSAAKLGGRPVLASWLYTVALRQARKARARAARRDALERATPARPDGAGDPLDEISGRELLQVIDDELGRLPDRLRLPVLLCCVQGLSRDEAARRLGWSDGALKGRLERGRRKLAARLAARGLAPALLLAPFAAVAVPADLLARTAEQAAAPWAETVPAAVAALAATGAGRSLVPAALAGCLVVGFIGAAFALGGSSRVKPLVLPTSAGVPPARAAEPEIDDPLPAGAALRFGNPRFRHPTTIDSLAVSPDGAFAVAGSGGRINGAVRAYDLATGRVRFALSRESGEGDVEGVAISPDGKTLATKRNFSVYLHDAATGKPTARIPYPSSNPYSSADLIVFAPDGKHLAVLAAEGKALHVVGLTKGEVVRTLSHADAVFAAAFSPDGRRLVGGGYDSEKGAYFARLWDAETGKELHRLTFGGGGIRSVAYSPDGATIAVGGDGGKAPEVKLFDAATGKERLKIPFPEASSVRSVAFSPDGKTLAASGGSSTRLFEVATGKERLKIDRQAVGLRFAPDGASLVGAVAGTVYRWDAATGRSLIPAGGDSPLAQLEVTADGKRVVTRGQDGDAHVWDARTDEHLRRVNVTWQRGLAVSPDGRFLVWPAADETIQFKDADQPNATHTGSRLRMLDLATDKLVERFDGFEGDAHDLFFTAGGKALVTVDHRDGAVRFWNVATGKAERSFSAGEKGTQYRVWRTRLSPDGTVLAAAYHPSGRGLFGTHAVKLWDTATGKELHDLSGHKTYIEALAFSPDGKHLVTAGGPLAAFAQQQLKLPADQVFVWSTDTGKLVARLPTGGTAGAFAPDGNALAVAEVDGTVRLWDAATWQARGEFRGPRERVTALAFGPGGELYSGAADATVLAWDLRLAKPAAPK